MTHFSADRLAHYSSDVYKGIAPWRYPINVMPEFAPTFGKFFTGEPLTEPEVCYAELDAILRATGARITHHWRCPKPRYDRKPLDRILLPPRSRFINRQQYHASRIHEVIHYLEGRVGWVGSPDLGELIAECATGFLESFLRLVHDQDNTNIKKWLSAWTKEIESDPAYLFAAVAQAERSVNYLLDLPRRKVAAA